MSFFQILVYSIILLLVIGFVRKTIQARKIRQYSADEAKNKLKDRSALFLDVRTPQERKSNVIKGSIHIPVNQLASRMEELRKYQNKEFICYCRSGNRSVSAAVMLNKKGFNASNLKGGITRWNF